MLNHKAHSVDFTIVDNDAVDGSRLEMELIVFEIIIIRTAVKVHIDKIELSS